MRQLYLCGAGNPEGVRLALRVNERDRRWNEILLLDDDMAKVGSSQLGLVVAGPFQLLENADPSSSEVVNLIARTTRRRRAARERIASFGVPFASLVSSDVDLLGAEVGSDLMAYQHATIGPDVRIGEGAVIFMGATIGHESKVGDHCVVAANAVLNARVRLGEGVYVGSNAVVLPEVEIGDEATIGAGAVVIDNVPSGASVIGGIGDVVRVDGHASAAGQHFDLTAVLRQLWCEALGVDHISQTETFFDAGGTSLAAMQLAQRIEAATGLPVCVVDLFHYPTLREFTAHLNADRSFSGGAAWNAAQRRANLRRGALRRSVI